VSGAVQGSPSLQEAVLGAKTHPEAGAQLSEVQGLLSLHTAAAPGAHTPAWHVSPTVQALLSLQGPDTGAFAQPEAGTHVSAVQGLLSEQMAGAPGKQLP
jgi:hypothetical protein